MNINPGYLKEGTSNSIEFNLTETFYTSKFLLYLNFVCFNLYCRCFIGVHNWRHGKDLRKTKKHRNVSKTFKTAKQRGRKFPQHTDDIITFDIDANQ